MSEPTSAPPAQKSRQGLTIGIAAGLVVALIVGAWWIGRRGAENAGASSTGAQQPFQQTEQIASVTRGSMADTVSAEGTVAAADTDDLSFSSSGTVTAVNVKAGDTVKAGQVLASIDATSLKADVVSATSTLADAKAKLADDEDASADDEQLEADRTSVTSAADALSDAMDALEGANLVATFPGTVASVDLTVGEVLSGSGSGGTTPTGSGSGSGLSSAPSSSSNNGGVNPSASSSNSSSTAQIQVVSTGKFTVDLGVDSSDIESVKDGQSVTLTVTTGSSGRGGFGGFPGGFGGNFPGGLGGLGGNGNNRNGANGGGNIATGATATGKVTSVSKVASASSGVATYTVTVAFDADPKQFFVGSTVSGAITTASRNNVVQVPSRAVSNNNGVPTVTVAVDGTTNGKKRTQEVTTGVTINGQTEIVSGLTAGQKVIVTGIRLPGATGTNGGNGGGNNGNNNGGGFPGGAGGFPGGNGGGLPAFGGQG